MWRRALDAQLRDIVERSLAQTLSDLIAYLSRSHVELGDAEWLPQLDVRLSLRNQALQSVPSFEELRSTLVMSYLNPSLREATTVRSLSRRRRDVAYAEGVWKIAPRTSAALWRRRDARQSSQRRYQETTRTSGAMPFVPFSSPSQERVSFVCLDVEDLVPQLTDPVQWRDVFAALRECRQTLASLPVEKSLGCCTPCSIPSASCFIAPGWSPVGLYGASTLNSIFT